MVEDVVHTLPQTRERIVAEPEQVVGWGLFTVEPEEIYGSSFFTGDDSGRTSAVTATRR